MKPSYPVYPAAELIAYARRQSPFYRDLYQGLPPGVSDLSMLPVIDQKAFWQANRCGDNRLLTALHGDGLVFKSGGTTGAPKVSAFTQEEWTAFTCAFGRGMARRALKANDRLANLFYVGDLYASFLFIMGSIERSGVPVLQLPIGGATSQAAAAGSLSDFAATVVAGVPTTLIALAQGLTDAGQTVASVERVLYGGEMLFPDQKPLLLTAFPNAEILSLGYASVDAGLLGYADERCGDGEHVPFTPETILELVSPDSGMVIEDVGVPGRVIITNLTRRLMPILRYPAGDQAVWLDPLGTPGRRYRLIGRSEEGARIGPVSVYLEEIRQILRRMNGDGLVPLFQLVIEREGGRDRLTVHLAQSAGSQRQDELQRWFCRELYTARPLYLQLVNEDKILAPHLVWTTVGQFFTNARTGKQPLLVDRRQG